MASAIRPSPKIEIAHPFSRKSSNRLPCTVPAHRVQCLGQRFPRGGHVLKGEADA